MFFTEICREKVKERSDDLSASEDHNLKIVDKADEENAEHESLITPDNFVDPVARKSAVVESTDCSKRAVPCGASKINKKDFVLFSRSESQHNKEN